MTKEKKRDICLREILSLISEICYSYTIFYAHENCKTFGLKQNDFLKERNDVLCIILVYSLICRFTSENFRDHSILILIKD